MMNDVEEITILEKIGKRELPSQHYGEHTITIS